MSYQPRCSPLYPRVYPQFECKSTVTKKCALNGLVVLKYNSPMSAFCASCFLPHGSLNLTYVQPICLKTLEEKRRGVTFASVILYCVTQINNGCFFCSICSVSNGLWIRPIHLQNIRLMTSSCSKDTSILNVLVAVRRVNDGYCVNAVWPTRLFFHNFICVFLFRATMELQVQTAAQMRD